MNYIWLNLLFFITYISSVSAQKGDAMGEGAIRVTSGFIVKAIFLWGIGLTFVFGGKRVIKSMLFVVGFIFFSTITMAIAGDIVDFDYVTNVQAIGITLGVIIFGILGGVISWWVYKFGIAILGFLMGYSIGGFMVNGISGLENNYGARLGTVVACGIAVAILMIFFMNIMIVIATSFVGSQMFMVGVDMIANKGYTLFVEVRYKSRIVHMSPTLWAMLGSSLFLFLIGILAQWKAYPKAQYYELKDDKN